MSKDIVSVQPNLYYEEFLRYTELTRGFIRLDREIGSTTTSKLLSELTYVYNLKINPITISISSPGGDAYHAFAMYDAIVDLRRKSVTINALVEGWAASAAAMIVLQAFDIRRARENARFLLHEARRWVFFAMEKTSDLIDEVTEMEAIEKRIIEILSKRCEKSESEIKSVIERKEAWMSAKEAKEWGLIDEIV